MQLQLSINDQDYSHENVLFEYQHMAHVQHILPNKGGVEDGGMLVVSGSHFSERSASL